MNKFFYYFYILSLLFLVYLFGFISFKYDLFPKSWLNGSINLFIKDLGESKRTILLNGIKSISENKNSDEFQYTIKRNFNADLDTFKKNEFPGYMLLSLSNEKYNKSNFGLYKNFSEKIHSWSFKETIKPTVMLHIFPN